MGRKWPRSREEEPLKSTLRFLQAMLLSGGSGERPTPFHGDASCSNWPNSSAAKAKSLAKMESVDVGKPMILARGDVAVCARYSEYYGAAADKVHGETIPFQNGHTVMTFYEPHGVTLPSADDWPLGCADIAADFLKEGRDRPSAGDV